MPLTSHSVSGRHARDLAQLAKLTLAVDEGIELFVGIAGKTRLHIAARPLGEPQRALLAKGPSSQGNAPHS
jgi:hypothetical protein